MSLLSLRNLVFTWGGPQLLDGVDLDIDLGQRIGLLGRNGAGKSTLMKIVAGEVEPDHGEIKRASGLRVARLVQEVPAGHSRSVAEIVTEGYLQAGEADDGHAAEWKTTRTVERVLARMSLDGQADFATLSSGMKRRALLAQALVAEPNILLLDEPTNHLDIESITWLEGFLKSFDGALVFVTHDRAFLQNLATRIVEIDRGRLFDWACDYATFLSRKAAALEAEEKQKALFDKKLAQEEAWIRQGIKARRTRNEGRVRALKKLREERRRRREQLGNVSMQAVEAERSGRLVIEAKHLCFSYGAEPIVDDFSILITRGDKIGVIGPNGSGKTTLLKLLLGELQPTSGELRHGARLEVIYFDQLRQQIDDEATVLENVGEGSDTLLIDGQRRHIYGYLQDFLFTPERARQQAKFLSGGERNRLLLARLFKHPSNVMVLDEPTNDLDAETLELLEELVSSYAGTLLLVSHDRAFLNNVVTSTLVFEGRGRMKTYDGGYDDYVRQRDAATASDREPAPQQRPTKSRETTSAATGKPAKLSFREQRELEALPERIEGLESHRAALHDAMADPSFFKQDKAAITAAHAELATLEATLQESYARWEELEARG